VGVRKKLCFKKIKGLRGIQLLFNSSANFPIQDQVIKQNPLLKMLVQLKIDCLVRVLIRNL